MMHRLGPHPAEWIERDAPLRFTFEGQAYHGFRGDTLSSALAAEGVAYLARSFKYHRPRHVLSFANHDSNVLLQVNGVPNVRGDVTLLEEGMRVTAVNTFGGLTEDRARWLDHLGRFLPVGFYYKAFHGKRAFPRWERMFRTLTGLGRVPLDAARQLTAKRYGFCDVLVIGAGPSGLSAALAAAKAGARVTVVDEGLRAGGSGMGLANGEERATRALVEAVQSAPSVTLCSGSVAAGVYADTFVAVVDGRRMTKLRAKAVVFATGVIEQPAVFRNNDLPGVMLASAAWRLMLRHRVAPGRVVVMVAANLEAYQISLDLQAQGVRVAALVDLRSAADATADAAGAAAVEAAQAAGIEILWGHAPYAAIAGADATVCALSVAPLASTSAADAPAPDATRSRRLDCDAVLMSVGWAAAAQLLLQAGGTTRFDPYLQQFVPDRLLTGQFAAGRLTGVYDFEARVAQGASIGAAAAAHAVGAPAGAAVGAGAAAPPAATANASVAGARPPRRPSHVFPIIDHPQAKNFVDFDEDLQVKDLENAAQEGFDSSELLKRYSTVGMGPSQGKHSNMNALRILARHRGVPVGSLGLTTSRPFYHPVPLKLLAGRSFHPERRTPVDALHAALGAVWMPAGNWRRPEFYPVAGESRAESITAEVAAVRSGVGLIDVGTLGKIEVHGPEAGGFLERVYTGKFTTLRPGMTRYGLMLDESGVIIDDGVIARLTPNLFYFTTTTGGSATVFRELLRLNALWGMNCALVNLTGHRAAFNWAGPASRALLQPLTDVDLSDAAFPFLGVRTGRVAGWPARLLRVGFVGEWGYEIHVAAGAAVAVWQALHAAGMQHAAPGGAPAGGGANAAQRYRPFGVEAQRILRLEKGHFIVGQDTDGLTDPFEAQAAWAVNMQKPFFVGQRSLEILKRRGPRQVLVGFELPATAALPKECHLVINQGEIAGRVTSVTRSPTLNKIIGLAMVAPQLARVGGVIEIRGDLGAVLRAAIVPTPFYDPQNARQRAAVAA